MVCEHITNSGECTHVEVPPNEIDVVLSHVCVEPSEQSSGSVTFLGHNIVDVHRAKCDSWCSRK